MSTVPTASYTSVAEIYEWHLMTEETHTHYEFCEFVWRSHKAETRMLRFYPIISVSGEFVGSRLAVGWFVLHRRTPQVLLTGGDKGDGKHNRCVGIFSSERFKLSTSLFWGWIMKKRFYQQDNKLFSGGRSIQIFYFYYSYMWMPCIHNPA